MKTTLRHLPIRALTLLLCSLVLSGCLPLVAAREIAYRPSPSDPYRLWRAYVTDSGLLYLCGSIDNGREGDKRVERVYNLELRLEETFEPLRSDAIQTIQIDNHPSLRRTKGYLSDLCQFDKKRATKRPDETGWTDVFLDSWDEGYVKVHRDDVRAGRLPPPPAEPRVVIYRVHGSDPPEYLLMGKLLKDGQERQALLVLGSEHIKALW
jgi:hypothetical protein